MQPPRVPLTPALSPTLGRISKSDPIVGEREVSFILLSLQCMAQYAPERPFMLTLPSSSGA